MLKKIVGYSTIAKKYREDEDAIYFYGTIIEYFQIRILGLWITVAKQTLRNQSWYVAKNSDGIHRL